MSAATLSRWTRLFVVASVAWFVCWQVSVALGAGRRLAVVLGVYGFVLHVVFGKAYALVPSYFDRDLAVPRAPAVHLPLAVGGTAAMALDAAGVVPWRTAGALAWALGCAVFLSAIGYSVRDNLTGRETGTSDAKAERRPIDRFANAFVPVALGYLLVGAVLPVADAAGVASPLSVDGPPTTHLFAAGTAALLLFAVGFRLLPRFLVVSPRRPLVAVVLPAAAVGPLLLASDFDGGRPFLLGASLQAVALLGFAAAYVDMFLRSDRRRVGLYVLLVAVASGAAVALLGLHMAAGGVDTAAADAHARIALLGFLGLAVVGVSYQFYPPAVASVTAVDDRTAATAVALLVAGLLLEAAGLLSGSGGAAVVAGRWIAALGAVVHAVVLGVVFAERRGR